MDDEVGDDASSPFHEPDLHIDSSDKFHSIGGSPVESQNQDSNSGKDNLGNECSKDMESFQQATSVSAHGDVLGSSEADENFEESFSYSNDANQQDDMEESNLSMPLTNNDLPSNNLGVSGEQRDLVLVEDLDETSERSLNATYESNARKILDNENNFSGFLRNSDLDYSESKTQSDLSSPEPLPDCRNKRSYVCGYCNMKTLNPREYLYHMKDAHKENFKIFECSLCTYASKTQQKLMRHNHLVHKIEYTAEMTDEKKRNKEKEPKSSQLKVKSSAINRSPRESKSPRRFEEYEFIDDTEMDYDDLESVFEKNVSGKPIYNCEQCKFSTFSLKVLGNHENNIHLKRKFFKCPRCNYATQIKARYTKHLKYHDLPIIKCEFCDFRTPYRWNLDRHMKNHVEGFGEHCCHTCNFSAPLRQSLTFHIVNHHLTPEQIKEREAKRTIGVSDFDENLPDEEMELLRLERDEDPESLELPPLSDVSFASPEQNFTVSNIDMGSQEYRTISENGLEEESSKAKKPKIKITLKKMKSSRDTFSQGLNERHNFDDDFIHPDDVVHRNGNVYIKTEKCSLCPFKAPFQIEIQRHKKKVHGIQALRKDDGYKKKNVIKNVDHFGALNTGNNSSKKSNIGLIVNLNSSSLKQTLEKVDDIGYVSKEKSVDDENFQLEDASNSVDLEPTNGKKKPSFFDKLQEKISTSNVQNLVCQYCGHESKCLSESVRHQKLHLSAKNSNSAPSLSTRCQFCRQRCKTTDDLVSHLKSCPEARKNQVNDMQSEGLDESSGNASSVSRDYKDSSADVSDEESMTSELENKHPMENKVFVWNNLNSDFDDKAKVMEGESVEVDSPTTSDEDSLLEAENMGEDQSENPDTRMVFKKKVFRCPLCPFWAQTASRFHGHMIVHYNTKPFRCSECNYRSNWRWDITKHIKIKISKEQTHADAEIFLDDETGETNYKKYHKYLQEITLDEMCQLPSSKELKDGRCRGKRSQNDSIETDSAKSSPSPSPLTIPSVSNSTSSGASSNKIPAPPKLTRAPNRQFASSPGPKANGPVISGSEMMIEMNTVNSSDAAAAAGDLSNMKFAMKPPPLVAMGALAQQHRQQNSSIPTPAKDEESSSTSLKSPSTDADRGTELCSNTDSNYQIITPQGSMNTSLETVQLLAAGSTNLAKLKQQQKETGEGNDPELDAAVANQMRLLILLNCLAREAGKKGNEAAAPSNNDSPNEIPGISNVEDSEATSVMQLVLDHEGNPEWKCLSCDFRDHEKETVSQHVRLAHGKKGPVSLVHAVHRCSVCGFAAGTKRHVQLHLDTAHNGQGGIISRSEGQNVSSENGSDDPDRSFKCRLCPFTCKKRSELKAHLGHHTPRADFVFKCMFCPFYVANKNDLFAHLVVHGMALPAAIKEAASNGVVGSNLSSGSAVGQNSVPSEDGNGRHFVCDLCPFETRSRAKLMHHRQFHRPRGLPFSCPHCSYNVTRRHLLAQHLRIHGVSPTDCLEVSENGSVKSSGKNAEISFSRSKSPSPSLTITPIASSKMLKDKTKPVSSIDPSCLPTLSNELTKNLREVPLVWVSRDHRYYKLYKCRHCPHVNSRKSNIHEHEKMHRPQDPGGPIRGHSCHLCSYTCINAGVLSSHLKVHGGSMGICHAIVDQALPNEEQLKMLAGAAMKKAISERMMKKGDEKLLYYCQHCPARFFLEKEVQIHSRFHNSKSNLVHHCSKCDFGARDESQILNHAKVHTPEYQERTRTLMSMHPSAPSFPPTSGLSVSQDVVLPVAGLSQSDNTLGTSNSSSVTDVTQIWINSTLNGSGGGALLSQPPPTSRFKCDQCPATFSKLITLQYHQSLHSTDNPFRCNRCTYAAKTQDGLQQHVALHDQADSEKNSTASVFSASPSPISSPPLNTVTKSLEDTLGSLTGAKLKKGLIESFQDSLNQFTQPPIKMKFIGMKDTPSSSSSKQQFKYYIEEQVPLSGIELLKRKTQIEKEMPKSDLVHEKKVDISGSKVRDLKQDTSGNTSLYYPLFIDKSSGRSREKRYKCSLCPSAFEKMDQYNVHINLHGSNYKYKCKLCDYSVKFYANFMMHMKRHKYHEKMDAQKRGLPAPLDDQMKYEPIIGVNPAVEQTRVSRDILLVEEKNKDKENHFDFDAYPDMTTAEKQQLILQDKKSESFKPKDEDRKIFYCQYCPYANLRRDAVDSHSLRHQANMGRGHYQCNFCDYTAAQPNFIREHTKVHFRPFKYVQPEGYMRHDKLEIWSINPGDNVEDDTPKKSLIFGHDEGNFTPEFKRSGTEESLENLVDSQVESGIGVDFRAGDVVEAPTDFIIPLRPGKSKSSVSNSSGYSKHKSKTSRKARKKTKLESPLTLSDLSANEDSKPGATEIFENGDGAQDSPSVLASPTKRSPSPPPIEEAMEVEGGAENVNTTNCNYEPMETE